MVGSGDGGEKIRGVEPLIFFCKEQSLKLVTKKQSRPFCWGPVVVGSS